MNNRNAINIILILCIMLLFIVFSPIPSECINQAHPNEIQRGSQEISFQQHYNSPLDDPTYAEGRNRSYEIVGVEKAWDIIKKSGVKLSNVRVSIVDDGLYKGYGEFDGVVQINTKSNGSLLNKPSPHYPYVGSHGTGIMNIIAADPDNGGLVGIASEPLRSNLTVTMINMSSPIFSKSGDAWYMGYLKALTAAGIGSDIVSFSWGNSRADPNAVLASEEYLKEWAIVYPDLLFVCSAGNDGEAIDGLRRFPFTYNLPNVITVGCINNNGISKNSNKVSKNFEVTLAAPGEEAVFGRDKDGVIVNSSGGAGMAVPYVTATAAIIRSINPSLTAKETKDILVETARESINVDGKDIRISDEVGGRVLAVDLAVKKVIYNNTLGIVDSIYVNKNGQLVKIKNYDACERNLTNWKLQTNSSALYIFPNFIIEPSAIITVHLGMGKDISKHLFGDNIAFNEKIVLYSNSAPPSDKNEEIYLYDEKGKMVDYF